MSIIGKWALQAVVVFLFAWLATVAAQWGSRVATATSNDRLAVLSSVRLSTGPVASGVNKSAPGNAVVAATSGQGNE
jgi:hypothetical protein